MSLHLALVFAIVVPRGADSGAAPSIKADGGDLVLRTGEGSTVFMQAGGSGPRSEVISTTALDTKLSGFAATQQRLLDTVAELKAEMKALRAENAELRGVAIKAVPVVDALEGQVPGVGLTVAVTPTEAEAEATGEPVEALRLTAGGAVGVGVSSPRDKLDIDGNIRVSGDVYAGAGAVNLVEEVAQLKAQAKAHGIALELALGCTSEVRADLLAGRVCVKDVAKAQDTMKSHPSCDDYHKAATALGRTPASGQYTLHLESGDAFVVWCEMREDGGWIRVGTDTNFTWVDVDEGNNDAVLVASDELAMLGSVATALGGFSEWEASCDTQLMLIADNSANDHRVYYGQIETLMKGAAFAGGIAEKSMMMGEGGDHTMLLSRGGTCVLNDGSQYSCMPEVTHPADCTAVHCGGNVNRGKSSCGRDGKPAVSTKFSGIVYTRFEFRPRTRYTHKEQWRRNRYTLSSSAYYVYFK